jgi:hypothetical protein
MRWRSYRQSQLRPTSPGFKNFGWRLEPFDEVQVNDITVSLWLLPPGSGGARLPFFDARPACTEPRGADRFRSTGAALLAKQNERFGNRLVVTERVYRLTHQYIVRVGRAATGDGLSPVSD